MTETQTTTDRLLFRQATDSAAGQRIYGWTGPWPPPERMTIVTAPSGSDAVCETGQNPTALAEVATLDSWRIEHFRLYRASEIDHAAPADERWFRGAEYLPVDAS